MTIENLPVPVSSSKLEVPGKDSPEMLWKIIELEKKERRNRNILLEKIKAENENLKKGLEKKIEEFNILIQDLENDHQKEVLNRDGLIADQEAELVEEKRRRLRQRAEAFEEHARSIAVQNELEEQLEASVRRLESLKARLVQNEIDVGAQVNEQISLDVIDQKKKLLEQFKVVLTEKQTLIRELGSALAKKKREIEDLKVTLEAQKKNTPQSPEHIEAVTALKEKSSQLRDAQRPPLDIEIIDRTDGKKDIITRLPLSSVGVKSVEESTKRLPRQGFFARVKSFFGF